MLSSNLDFSLAYFTNFNFAHFEIEESFGLILVKLQNGRFYLQIFLSGIQKTLVSIMGFIFFLILCITEVLRKFGLKLKNDPLELTNTFGIFW